MDNVERIVTGVLEAAKDIKAGWKGLTGVFMHLMEEHGKVGALIKRVIASEDDGVRAELYPTIRKELLAHERGELMVVYPALADFPETGSIVAAHAHEASDLDAAIAELDALSFDAAGWKPAFERLAALVDAHVDHEEGDFFPTAQQALGEERAQSCFHFSKPPSSAESSPALTRYSPPRSSPPGSRAAARHR